jgi:chromosome segregation ATPase
MTVQGFKGRIADKIKPTNKKYAQCFGQLMAPIENSLLVENEQAAKDLAARLKDLCSIKNVVILSNVNDKDQNVAAFRRELGKNGTPAADIVDFDRDLNGLEGYLMLALKGKAVCDSLDDAFRLR